MLLVFFSLNSYHGRQRPYEGRLRARLLRSRIKQAGILGIRIGPDV